MRLRARAAQARTTAAEVGDQLTRANLLNVATRYDNAADIMSRFSSERDTVISGRTRPPVRRQR